MWLRFPRNGLLESDRASSSKTHGPLLTKCFSTGSKHGQTTSLIIICAVWHWWCRCKFEAHNPLLSYSSSIDVLMLSKQFSAICGKKFLATRWSQHSNDIFATRQSHRQSKQVLQKSDYTVLSNNIPKYTKSSQNLITFAPCPRQIRTKTFIKVHPQLTECSYSETKSRTKNTQPPSKGKQR